MASGGSDWRRAVTEPRAGANRSRSASIEVSDDDDGIRLDRWLRRHFPDVGHGLVQKFLRTGQIRLDGGRVQAGQRVIVGQRIRVPPALLVAETDRAKPGRLADRVPVKDRDLADLLERVIYRDDDVLILNKPPGLAVQGGSNTRVHLDALLDTLCFSGARPRLVHRLDKDTSGVLVLARSAAAAAALARSFRAREVEKIYWAITVGVPELREGRIDLPLTKRWGGGGERVVPAPGHGLPAVTEFSVIERVGEDIAWLALHPVTGRTHQLRAHCAAIGAPILGDGKYGGAAAHVSVVPVVDRVHLHARGLRIPHPKRGLLVVEAALPDHMRATFGRLNFAEPRPRPSRREPD